MIERLHSLKLRATDYMLRATDFLRKEDGAVAFEYVLILGGISAVIIGLLFGTVPGSFAFVVTFTCNQIQLIAPGACN